MHTGQRRVPSERFPTNRVVPIPVRVPRHPQDLSPRRAPFCRRVGGESAGPPPAALTWPHEVTAGCPVAHHLARLIPRPLFFAAPPS